MIIIIMITYTLHQHGHFSRITVLLFMYMQQKGFYICSKKVPLQK